MTSPQQTARAQAAHVRWFAVPDGRHLGTSTVVPIQPEPSAAPCPPTRLLGEGRGHYEVPDDFDAPLSDEEHDGFGG